MNASSSIGIRETEDEFSQESVYLSYEGDDREEVEMEHYVAY